MPKCDATNGTNDSTAFNSDGSLKTAWMTRLDQVIRAADANGMVVTVSLFYQAQMPRIADNAAVLNGMDNVTDWLVAGGYKNVLVELATRSTYRKTSSKGTRPSQEAELSHPSSASKLEAMAS
jgi:hypothetical protein